MQDRRQQWLVFEQRRNTTSAAMMELRSYGPSARRAILRGKQLRRRCPGEEEINSHSRVLLSRR
jgi:hypothetical protein